MSRTGGLGHSRPVWVQAARRNPTSKRALCATSTAPVANSRKAARAGPSRGAVATMGSVMPVRTEMTAGMGTPGLTNVWNSPRTSPPRTFTAPISVMAQSAGLPPVVSRSTTTKVTPASLACRGSSRVPWMPARAGWLMACTLGRGADNVRTPAGFRAWPGCLGEDPLSVGPSSVDFQRSTVGRPRV